MSVRKSRKRSRGDMDMYDMPAPPGATYVVLNEGGKTGDRSENVDGESVRVEYNNYFAPELPEEPSSHLLQQHQPHLLHHSHHQVPIVTPTCYANSVSKGHCETKQDRNQEVGGGPESVMEGTDAMFEPPEREDSFGAFIEAPRAETDSFLLTSSDNPIQTGIIKRPSHEWHGFASQDAGRMN